MLSEAIESLKDQRENFDVIMVASDKISEVSEESALVDGADYGLNEWGYKSLVKRFKVPVSFYTSLSQDIRQKVWKFATTMAPEERTFSQLVIQKDTKEISGVLNQDSVLLPTEQILEAIPENWTMVSGARVNLFDPVNSFRFVDGDHDVEDKTFIGFDINNSEVGGSPFIIEALLYREVCSNGMFAKRKLPAGYSSFVSLPYEGLSHELMRAIAVNLTQAMCGDERLAYLSQCVNKAKGSRLNLDEYLDFLMLQMDKGFAKRVSAATEGETISSNFDLAMIISDSAKGLPLKRAQKFEAEAGLLLNLTIDGAAY